MSRFASSRAWVLFLFLVAGAVLVGCGPGDVGDDASSSVCDPDDGGLTLPDGFCATVVADSLGPTRHMAVAENGDLYASLDERTNGSGVVALRDTTGNYKADRVEYFSTTGGMGLDLRGGYLYFGPHTAVWRYRRQPGELVPSGEREVIVTGYPDQPTHDAKTLAFDGDGQMYVNVGAPSNACMEETRTKGSPGQDPCPQLEHRAGVWQYPADQHDQEYPEAGTRYATGIRNANAIDWRTADSSLYVVQHGRDNLYNYNPDLYTDEEGAELPAEEFFRVNEGDNFGWPYCYYDWMQETKVLAPEYGGDGETVGRCDQFEDPILAFPGHWAPNDLLFSEGRTSFPETYQNGAFIAWHGSWNRAPLPQEGYKVTFVPFEEGEPSDDYETFADGFAGTDTLSSAGAAEYRPSGLAIGPDGGLYVSEDQRGRIWRIAYVGEDG